MSGILNPAVKLISCDFVYSAFCSFTFSVHFACNRLKIMFSVAFHNVINGCTCERFYLLILEFSGKILYKFLKVGWHLVFKIGGECLKML